MKSLQTIQKTFRVFQILTRIGMILSFVWAGMAFAGLLCGIAWQSGVTVVGADRELLFALTVTKGLPEMIGVLLTDVIFALTDGTLLLMASRYFKEEQAAGTPFTEEGAEQVKRLGIRTIVLPLVAVILCTVVYEVCGLSGYAPRDWDNLMSVSMGIVLILASLIFRYGAVLEAERAGRLSELRAND